MSSTFDNFKVMHYEIKNDNTVEFSNFSLNDQKNQKNKLTNGEEKSLVTEDNSNFNVTENYSILNDTHQVDQEKDEDSSKNEFDESRDIGQTSEKNNSKLNINENLKNNNKKDILTRLSDNSIKLADHFYKIYRDNFVVKKLKLLINFLKLKSIKFRILLYEDRIVLKINKTQIDLSDIVTVILGAGKLYKLAKINNLAFKKFVKLFKKNELKKIGLLKK